jgi:Spy/CpxP family protein refolding chaperone
MLLLAALAGAAIGATASHGLHLRGHGGGRGHGDDRYVEMLSGELGLTDSQKDSVRAILERRRPGIDSIWSEVAPQMQAWREGVREEIRALLTPEQQSRYADFTARRDAARTRRSNPDATRR